MGVINMYTEFESFLEHSLDDCPNGVVRDAALYSLMAGGKRIRPRLLFSVLDSYHVDQKKGFKCGAGIEMMHTYSLIHDDLPSMDNDTLRRGKPTCHVQYGEANAILAGDALLTHSFKMAVNASTHTSLSLQIVKEFADAGGLDGMIYGQELDIDDNSIDHNLEDLETIHCFKTGKLIALPMVCGAILAGKIEDVDIWREIGYMTGILFQIQDDVFDVIKTDEELGKNAHSDEDNEKNTYMSILGIEGCQEKINYIYNEIVKRLNMMNIDQEPMLAILNYIIKRQN